MSGAVRHIGDEVQVGALGTAQEAIHGGNQDFHDINVLPFVEAANVVGLGNLALVEDEVNGPGVVLHIQPVTDVLAFAVDRKGFPVTDVIDEQRN